MRKLPIFFLVFLLASFLIMLFSLVKPCYSDGSNWWNTDFAYRKKITFNNAAIGENLVNFQMPIVFYPNNTGFWAHVNRTTGTDVRFVDADNTTELYYEVEMFNVATNMTIYWVLVPQVNSGSTTDNIWVYYGNSHVGFDSYNSKTMVWSTSTYIAVWHLTETTGNYSDSTNNKNNVNTISGVTRTATGKFGATCPSFDGVNDYLSAPASTTLGAPADMLVEMWMRTTNYAQESGLISCNVVGNGWNIEMYPSKNVLFQFGEGVNPFPQTNDDRIAANNVWYHVAWRYVNSTNKVNFYVNGVNCTQTGSTPATHWTPQLVPTYIGMAKPASSFLYPYPGLMSEIRLSNTPKSAYWIQASYQYEVNQAKFTFMSEEALGTGINMVVSCSVSFLVSNSLVIGKELYRTASVSLIVTSNIQKNSALMFSNAETPHFVSSFGFLKEKGWNIAETFHFISSSLGARKELLFKPSSLISFSTLVKFGKETRVISLAETLHLLNALAVGRELLFSPNVLVSFVTAVNIGKETATTVLVVTATEVSKLLGALAVGKELLFSPSVTVSFTSLLNMGAELTITIFEVAATELLHLASSLTVGRELLFSQSVKVVFNTLSGMALETKMVLVELSEVLRFTGAIETVLGTVTTLIQVYALAAIGFILALVAIAIAVTKKD